jgi:hypothetical protein
VSQVVLVVVAVIQNTKKWSAQIIFAASVIPAAHFTAASFVPANRNSALTPQYSSVDP